MVQRQLLNLLRKEGPITAKVNINTRGCHIPDTCVTLGSGVAREVKPRKHESHEALIAQHEGAQRQFHLILRACGSVRGRADTWAPLQRVNLVSTQPSPAGPKGSRDPPTRPPSGPLLCQCPPDTLSAYCSCAQALTLVIYLTTLTAEHTN